MSTRQTQRRRRGGTKDRDADPAFAQEEAFFTKVVDRHGDDMLTEIVKNCPDFSGAEDRESIFKGALINLEIEIHRSAQAQILDSADTLSFATKATRSAVDRVKDVGKPNFEKILENTCAVGYNLVNNVLRKKLGGNLGEGFEDIRQEAFLNFRKVLLKMIATDAFIPSKDGQPPVALFVKVANGDANNAFRAHGRYKAHSRPMNLNEQPAPMSDPDAFDKNPKFAEAVKRAFKGLPETEAYINNKIKEDRETNEELAQRFNLSVSQFLRRVKAGLITVRARLQRFLP